MSALSSHTFAAAANKVKNVVHMHMLFGGSRSGGHESQGGKPTLQHQGSRPIMSGASPRATFAKAIGKVVAANRMTHLVRQGSGGRGPAPPGLGWGFGGPGGSMRGSGSAIDAFAAHASGPPTISSSSAPSAPHGSSAARRMSVSMRTVSRIKLEAKHDKERLEASLDREHERQERHTQERLARRKSQKALLSSAQGKELAELAQRSQKHMRRRRSTKLPQRPAAGPEEADHHGRRMSVSARTLHELQDEGRRDAEDLLLAMQNEKDRQHAHMKAKLRARRESKRQLLEAKAAARGEKVSRTWSADDEKADRDKDGILIDADNDGTYGDEVAGLSPR